MANNAVARCMTGATIATSWCISVLHFGTTVGTLVFGGIAYSLLYLGVLLAIRYRDLRSILGR